MKKIKRLLVLAMSLCMTIGLVTMPIHAEESTKIEELLSGYYVAYDTEGNITDYNMPISREEFEIKMNQRYSTTTRLTSGSIYMYDNGYHPFTNIWRRVSSYNFDTSKTYSASVGVGFSYAGDYITGSASLSISQAVSYSTGYTISVDQSRDSKLRVYTDFDWTYYLGEEYDNYTGYFQYSYYFTTFVKTAERFIPVYQ